VELYFYSPYKAFMEWTGTLYCTLLLSLFIFCDYCALFIYIAHRSCLKTLIVRDNRRHIPADNASRTPDVGNEEETLRLP
jgi:hypothetical protein